MPFLELEGGKNMRTLSSDDNVGTWAVHVMGRADTAPFPHMMLLKSITWSAREAWSW